MTDKDNTAPRFSEQWLALEFAAENRGKLRYTHQWKLWHIWLDGDHQYWMRDNELTVPAMAQEFCRRMSIAALDAHEGSTEGEKIARQLCTARMRNVVLSLARENSEIAMSPEDWDGAMMMNDCLKPPRRHMAWWPRCDVLQ